MRIPLFFRRRRLAFVAALLGSAALAAPAAAAPPRNPAGTTTQAVTLQGYDISFPQCGGTYPSHPAFGIVGVNDGRAFTANPCVGSEYAWALGSSSPTQPHVSFYLNTGNPGPLTATGGSPHWPTAGTTTPLPCDGTWSANCAYDYGWNAAQDSLKNATAVSGAAARSAPWWLDVETANSWSSDTTTNVADLRGEVDSLRNAGIARIGIYSTGYMWGQITGARSSGSTINAPFHALPNWVPGASNAGAAKKYCADTITGGPVLLTQYPSGGYDADYVCS